MPLGRCVSSLIGLGANAESSKKALRGRGFEDFMRTCMPVPIDVARSVDCGGLRSTSACTSFQPDSSSSSSFSSALLYL